MTPLSAKTISCTLIRRVAVRARQATGIASEIEVDAPTGRVKVDILDAPRHLQAQCAGEQRFKIPTVISKVSLVAQMPPRGFVDNSGYRVPH